MAYGTFGMAYKHLCIIMAYGTNLHKSVNTVNGAGILWQRIVRPNELVQISFLRRVQHSQFLHIRVSEQIHDPFQSANLPINVVVKGFVKLKLYDELVVDSASALVLLHGNVEWPTSD